MGAMLHPVGPEQPRVYWVRRLTVVVAVVVVLVLIGWMLWPKGGQPVAAEPATTSPVPVSTGPSEPQTTPSDSPTSPSPSPTPTGPVACENRYLTVSVVGFQRVKVSAEQTFKVAITNTGEQPCILDVSAATFDLTVTSGSDKIWTTEHCEKGVPAKKLTAKSGAGYEFEVEWPLRRSAEGCKLAKDKLRPGTYVGKGVYDDGPSGRQVFQLV